MSTTTPDDPDDAATFRRVLTDQAGTAHALKLARARLVLDATERGTKAAEMWASIDLATAELAEAAWRAEVEAKVLWAVRAPAIIRAARLDGMAAELTGVLGPDPEADR